MKINVYVVTGANSGLGGALVKALRKNPDSLVVPVAGPDFDEQEDQYLLGHNVIRGDLTDAGESMLIAAKIKEETEHRVRLMLAGTILETAVPEIYPVLINCAGVNYIEWFDQADFTQFDRLMDINVKAGLMLIQNLIGFKPPLIQSDLENWFRGTGAIVNIVSNASHVPMTNSAFYNASKGAFHIATLALARELRKTHGICVFGVSPNKLSGTGMSAYIEAKVPDLRGWTPAQAAQYQLAALPAGEETDPNELAEFLAYLLSAPRRHKYLTNTILPYGA